MEVAEALAVPAQVVDVWCEELEVVREHFGLNWTWPAKKGLLDGLGFPDALKATVARKFAT